ncbi:MAG: transcriptional regulator [Deltaproteobacteria bacterium]|nr:transcriptional regulator [Deltaproteobacteria bacterium]
MNMLFIAYDAVLDAEVIEVLELAGVAGFTKWNRVLGQGSASGPRLDTPVWPGYNCCLMVAVDRDLTSRLHTLLTSLRTESGIDALRIFAWPVVEMS